MRSISVISTFGNRRHEQAVRTRCRDAAVVRGQRHVAHFTVEMFSTIKADTCSRWGGGYNRAVVECDSRIALLVRIGNDSARTHIGICRGRGQCTVGNRQLRTGRIHICAAPRKEVHSIRLASSCNNAVVLDVNLCLTLAAQRILRTDVDAVRSISVIPECIRGRDSHRTVVDRQHAVSIVRKNLNGMPPIAIRRCGTC